MDISKASNFERFVYDLTGRRGEQVRTLWGEVDRGGAFDLSTVTVPGEAEHLASETLFAKVAGFGFQSGSSSHAHRMAMIRSAWEQWGVMIDTHTADGLKVALERREAGVPMLVLETALPAKFEEAIQEALGCHPARPSGLENIEDLPQRFEVMAADAAAVKQFIINETTG